MCIYHIIILFEKLSKSLNLLSLALLLPALLCFHSMGLDVMETPLTFWPSHKHEKIHKIHKHVANNYLFTRYTNTEQQYLESCFWIPDNSNVMTIHSLCCVFVSLAAKSSKKLCLQFDTGQVVCRCFFFFNGLHWKPQPLKTMLLEWREWTKTLCGGRSHAL